MTHCARRSRARVGHQTVTGPVTPTCLHDRWGRVEATRTALGEALVMRRRTRVRFPPPPPPLFHHVGPGQPTGPYVRVRARRASARGFVPRPHPRDPPPHVPPVLPVLGAVLEFERRFLVAPHEQR